MTAPTNLADALASATGGKFVRWDDLGQGVVVEGRIVDVTMRQTYKLKRLPGGKFERNGLDTWDDGNPKMEAAITLRTALRDQDDPDDDGVRILTVNLWSGQKRALVYACRAAGVPEPKPGDQFAAVWTSGAGEAGDPRVFAYRITPGTGLAGALGDTAAAVDPFEAARGEADAIAAASTPGLPVAVPTTAAPQGPATAPNPLAGMNLTPEVLAAIQALAAQK